MKTHLTWLAAAAASLCLCAGAGAQSRNDSVNCLNDMKVNASGTSSARGSAAMTKSKASRSASLRTQQMARERGTLPVAFPSCSAKTDRTARAECVRSAYEARHDALMASASGRRPC